LAQASFPAISLEAAVAFACVFWADACEETCEAICDEMCIEVPMTITAVRTRPGTRPLMRMFDVILFDAR
jgi:hypothetical protein